jgi:hypothetical protein
MSDETPKKRRRRKRSSDTLCVDTVLVEFTAVMVPHDSPEFQERARLAAQRPIPDYPKEEPRREEQPPTA